MARTEVITDDLDGSHDAQEVRFGWDEIWWSIDLGDANRTALLEALQPYLDKAHPAGRDASPPTRQRAPRGSGSGKAVITEAEYGEPRRGRASAEEQNYVKLHLVEVNERLKAKGMREIDPSDEKMKSRYGL